jgi:ADP-ribosylglycohydrolase
MRGAVLGLLLGDAVGHVGGRVPADGILRASCAGQLACFTLEGLIRADVRAQHKGICHAPGVVWHAYHRWGHLQGVLPEQSYWGSGGEPWPDGWLARVPALAIRRGSAPATVAAVRGGVMGTMDTPAGASRGAHALTRTLPVGLCGRDSDVPLLAAQIAAVSHCGDSVVAAAIGAQTVKLLCSGATVPVAAAAAQLTAAPLAPHEVVDLGWALAAARDHPADPSRLASLAPDARAVSALAGGVYVAASVARPEEVQQAMLLAVSTLNGGHVAAVAGALLGARYGADALPVGWLSQLDLAWAGDRLAHDFVLQTRVRPSLDADVPADTDAWWQRYPGW